MSAIHTTQIDERYRPGALKGLVKPRERYEVEKISEHEIRFRRLVTAETARPRVVRRGGRMLLSGRPVTNSDVQKALEEFP
jgi:hypothetical protein